MSIHGRRSDFKNVDFSEKQFIGKNFDDCDFTGANMRGSRFFRCSFVRAILRDCDLEDTNFSGCNLHRCDLANAKAMGANFRHANLCESKLADMTDPPFCTFGGANLADADMGPHPIYEKSLTVTEQIKQLGSNIFLMLSISAYCWLTIISTQDETLFNYFSFHPLPIIGTQVRYQIFYFAAPILMLAIYAYNLLLSYQIWGNLRHLPAIFPDGQPLSEKLPTWFPVAIAGWVLPQLRSKQFFVYLLAGTLSFLLVWCLPPLTVLGFWGRYIVVHDLPASLAHIAIFSIALLTGLVALRLTLAALGSLLTIRISLTAMVADIIIIGAATTAMVGVSQQAIFNRPTYARHLDRIDADPAHRIPNLLQSIGFRNYADLVYRGLSEKLDEREVGIIAHMANADLRYANAYGAYMAHGDLFGINAESARLGHANMSFADLRCANLMNADLYHANLKNADLQGSRLDNVRFGEFADLGNAKLMAATLHGTNMSDLIAGHAPEIKDFANACYDETTSFPKFFNGPPPGAKRDCPRDEIEKPCRGLDPLAPGKGEKR